MVKNIYFYSIIILSVIICNSCKKGNDSDENADILKFYIINSLEPAGPGLNSQNLTILNPDGSIKWRKINRNYADGIAYANGKLYASGVYNNNGLFHAYNMDTGAEIWAKQSPAEYFYSPVIRNDTLFCGMAIPVSSSVTNGYIAAYNPNSGALYWKKQVSNPFWPYILKLEGNIIYFSYTAMPGGIITIGTFNMSTQTVITTIPLGLAIITAPQSRITDDKIIITDGLQTLKALNKQTGAVVWTNTVVPYDHLTISGNNIYATSTAYGGFTKDGVYCIDINTGAQKWFWQCDWFSVNYPPSVADGKVYIAGLDGNANPYFMTAINAANGTTAWTTRLVYNNPNIKYPVAIGKKVYLAVENLASNFAFINTQYHSFNTSDGQRQSFDFPIPQTGMLYMKLLGESGTLY